MRAPTTVKLVRGVHVETPIPEAVHRCGWKYRTAIVIDSYVPDLPDMYFDSALFLRFLQAIDDAIGATSCHIRAIDPRTDEPIELFSIADLQDFYHGISEEERDLPEDIIWFDEAVMVGGGFPEKWHSVGGPDIYHDSFTFSAFTKKEIFHSVSAIAGEICEKSNSRLLGVYDGSQKA